MMREPGVGRVLVASLHQSIADLQPSRLAFYENWLHEGLRGGTIGRAPLYAVLSFLRQEPEVYDNVTTRAGTYAAEWTVASMAQAQRAAIKAAPIWLRGRLLLWTAQNLVRSVCPESRVVSRVQGGTARLDLRASVFCSVREPVAQPLCGFYAAAFSRLTALFDMPSRAEVVACRGRGEPSCVMTIALGNGRPPGAEG